MHAWQDRFALRIRLIVCADPAQGGSVLPTWGRDLPDRGLHMAAAGAGVGSAGAQPVRGGGGMAAGCGQAKTLPGPPTWQPARAAGAAVRCAPLAVPLLCACDKSYLCLPSLANG